MTQMTQPKGKQQNTEISSDVSTISKWYKETIY